MSKGTTEPKEISIEWEYAKDYRLVPATGILGGITPRGDLRIEFFVEAIALPAPGESSMVLHEDSGTYKETRKVPQKGKIVRTVQIGVTVPPHQVSSFAEWFKDKAEQARLKNVKDNPPSKVN